MDGVVSEIGSRHEPSRAKLFLQTQIPLVKLHALRVIVCRRYDRILRPYSLVGLQRLPVTDREWISPGLVGPWICEINIRPNKYRKERGAIAESLEVEVGRIVIERSE